jgi:hypothetical protein
MSTGLVIKAGEGTAMKMENKELAKEMAVSSERLHPKIHVLVDTLVEGMTSSVQQAEYSRGVVAGAVAVAIALSEYVDLERLAAHFPDGLPESSEPSDSVAYSTE